MKIYTYAFADFEESDTPNIYPPNTGDDPNKTAKPVY